MKTILFSAALLLAIPAHARTIMNHQDVFPRVTEQSTNISWRLANAQGDFVEYATTVSQRPGFPTQLIAYREVPDDVPGSVTIVDIDFPAWAAAFADPAYRYSTINFGPYTSVKALERLTNRPTTEFELDQWLLAIHGYSPIDPGGPWISAGLADVDVVPEPATLCLVLVAMAAISFVRRQHHG